MAEPPYGAIAELLRKGRVVPFLGAGASLTAVTSGGVDDWDEAGTAPPSGLQLAHRLAALANYPANELRAELAKVASYYQASVDRSSLVEALREVFDRDFNPGPIHRFLADAPAPLLIVTTNYDDLVERAFTEAKRPYHLVVHPTDRDDLAAAVLWWRPGAERPEISSSPELMVPLKDTSIIYKMHGGVDRYTGRQARAEQARDANDRWDAFVITEEDYVNFLTRMAGQRAIPACFLNQFRTSRFLFLGYGLADWNLRVMLNSLNEGTSRERHAREQLRSWAIQHNPSELERRLWEARSVSIYSVLLDEFVGSLRALMSRRSPPPVAGATQPASRG